MPKFIDSGDVLSGIKPGDNLSLELGCGESKVNKDSIAIDLIEFPGVDIVGDIYEVLCKIPSQSVKLIFSAISFAKFFKSKSSASKTLFKSPSKVTYSLSTSIILFSIIYKFIV